MRDTSIRAKDLMPVIRFFGKLMETGRYDVIDEIFECFVLGKQHPAMLMCMLRTTFMVRARLKEWVPFRDRVVSELRKQNFDTRILDGLFVEGTHDELHTDA